MSTDLKVWLPRLGRLRAVGVIVTAFDPGVQGYDEYGMCPVDLGPGGVLLVERLARQLHPELDDDKKAVKYYRAQLALRQQELKDTVKAARKLGLKQAKLWLAYVGYVLEGRLTAGGMPSWADGKIPVYASGATPQKALECFKERYGVGE